MTPIAIQKWHELLETHNMNLLDELLADDACLYSPVVHTPQKGKTITKMYLMGAAMTIGNENFKYVREVYGDACAVLEFETEMNGLYVNGIDMISWNKNDQITDFKVMIRPLKAVNMVHQMMGAALESFKKQ